MDEDDLENSDDDGNSSDCKSLSSIRELIIEKSFSEDEDINDIDRTESDGEQVRSNKSQDDNREEIMSHSQSQYQSQHQQYTPQQP